MTPRERIAVLERVADEALSAVDAARTDRLSALSPLTLTTLAGHAAAFYTAALRLVEAERASPGADPFRVPGEEDAR